MPDATRPPPRRPRRLHPVAVRVMHWINALAILMLLFSGLKIYDDYPILNGLYFAEAITLGGHPETALQWHFFAMWILGVNGLVYLAYGLVTGRFRRKLLPVDPREVVATVRDALRLHLGHDDIRHYNGVQKLLYLGVIAIVVLQVATGLAIWKPVQFSEFAALFGSFQTARILHFAGLGAIAGFLVVHVALALLVPKTLVAMVTGGPLEDPADRALAPSAPPATR
ncbi:cytochrome b/b6 domain-containing protein [Siculibacillus lacustris]|uniref:Cytochrome b/b6 domain-containing protein n=1 Tax=Siculibacillus lacustris TaxID=1549641 RepID=A0A4Q9VFE9_9HYPH|nr:cytochrome b/b6 domain-containing protein [Siculibacillus lacustris]TBW33434.1 cytochrome b/b6 domain-containing protein [Siculibacillus lacustris]